MTSTTADDPDADLYEQTRRALLTDPSYAIAVADAAHRVKRLRAGAKLRRENREAASASDEVDSAPESKLG